VSSQRPNQRHHSPPLQHLLLTSEPRVAAASVNRNAPVGERRFREGAHYELLTPQQPTSTDGDMVEVAEVFMYSCPHCFTFEPYLEQWSEGKADYVNFVRIPAAWNSLAELHARAFYAAEVLGKGEEGSPSMLWSHN